MAKKTKKAKLPEEIVDLIKEVESKEIKEEEIHDFEKRSDFQWDVPIDQPIEFFDKDLSYELTGYIPINETSGLDFKPEWFTEARDNFNRTGLYCDFRFGSKAFHDFWKEQYRRCRDGLTVNGYTVTGDHYFFMNFYRLKDLVNVKEAGAGRKDIFPNFLEGQYEWFHYLKMARKLRLNACMMKARSAGYSEIEAAILANSYTISKGSINVACAFAVTLLDKLLEKVYAAITFLDNNTGGGFSHGRVVDSAYLKRSGQYKMINGVKTPTGWMSQLQGLVVDKPGKLRGDRTDILVFEECFGKGTKVIMSNHTYKNIEDIKVGDFVLGLDGTPQEVMHTVTGIDNLYKVVLKQGKNYIINSKHKLYLERKSETGDVINLLNVSEYRDLSEHDRKMLYGKTLNNLDIPIQIEDYGKGEYFGITLKTYNKYCDNLFLLDDFTIVHNCGIWPNFTKAYTQADALVGQIGYLFGIRLIGGR